MQGKMELHVVGAGGTGTYFLKECARFLSSGYQKRISAIHIYDGDIVEKKNLSRQCFIDSDIGRRKAVVMAEILNATYPEVRFVAHPYYLVSKEQLDMDNTTGTLPVFISCVDNHACRLLLESVFDELRNCVLFDSANEFSTGEVVFACKTGAKVIGPYRSHYFPDIKEGDNRAVTEMSCEELNAVAPQHIYTNMVAGWQLCAGIANILEGTFKPGFTVFNSLTMQSSFVPYKGE